MWVLIIYLLQGGGGGPATAEFTSKEKCVAAGEAAIGIAWSGKFVCVEK